MSIINDALKKAQLHNQQFKKTNKDTEVVSVKSDTYLQGTKTPWVAVLIIVSIFALIFIRFRPTTQTVTYSNKNKETKLPITTDYKIPKIFRGKQDINSHLTNGPEQFSNTPSFELSGIVFGAGQVYAIINDKILEVGDKIGQAKIVRIEKDKVILSSNNQQITLTLR